MKKQWSIGFMVAGVMALSILSFGGQPKEGTPNEEPAAGMECTLFTAIYQGTERGAFVMPAHVRWGVRSEYTGFDDEGEGRVDPRLTLVLEDDQQSFWPVIAKMDLATAKQLRDDLDRIIAQKEAQTGTNP